MKVAVLISGRGSNLEKIIEHAEAEKLYEICVVIANKNCLGIDLAIKNNIPYRIVPYADLPSKEHAEIAIHGTLDLYGAELIVLAGFMKVLTPLLVNKWYGKIINIHPSLLPAFTGLNTHQRAIERGVKYHGCTVHYVDAGLDTGPIIAQKAVDVYPTDDVDMLTHRVLEQEHIILPKVIKDIALGNVWLDINTNIVKCELPGV